MKKSLTAAAFVIVSIIPSAGLADECNNAVGDYNAVLARLNDATQAFSACVADSLGVHRCSAQFENLQRLYGQFESAVDIYRKQCL